MTAGNSAFVHFDTKKISTVAEISSTKPVFSRDFRALSSVIILELTGEVTGIQRAFQDVIGSCYPLKIRQTYAS